MKTNKNTNKVMSALQFMKEFENTQQIMESIADATAVERKALLEADMGGQGYTDDDGVFDMNSLLDVEVSDKPENQPRYYNSPMDELNDSDKALIVDAFAKKLEEMKDDVIDFSDIGPIATVIKNTYGYKQDVEKFLQDTIQKTSNWMSQQNNTEANTNGVAENKDGGPTDIKPETSGIEGAGIEGGDMGIEGVPAMEEVPELTDTVADAEAIVPPVAEEVPPMGEDLGVDVGGEEVPPMGEDLGVEGGEDVGGEELGEDVGGEELAIEDETPAEETSEETSEEIEEDETPEEKAEGEEGEEKEEKEEKEDGKKEDEDDDGIDDLLESIMSDYQNSSKLKSAVDSINESIDADKKFRASQNKLKAQLEAISSNYHAKENAKVEAVRQEKALKAQLESIATNYKNNVKAKLEAVAKEKEIDDKLTQLLESHKQKTSNDGKTNLTARLEAKEKIEKLTK